MPAKTFDPVADYGVPTSYTVDDPDFPLFEAAVACAEARGHTRETEAKRGRAAAKIEHQSHSAACVRLFAMRPRTGRGVRCFLTAFIAEYGSMCVPGFGDMLANAAASPALD